MTYQRSSILCKECLKGPQMSFALTNVNDDVGFNPHPEDEGTLYVGLYGKCDCSSWRSGGRNELYPEALYSR